MICFVILHYQAIEETLACVANIKEKMTGEKKIIIVDNASPNGSGKILVEKFESDNEVIIDIENENIGFAKGNNVGYAIAKKQNPEFIVVMNNDVFFEDELIDEKIKGIFSKTDFDILGPDIFSTKSNIHQNPHRNKNFSIDELKKQKFKLHLKNKLKILIKLKYMIKKNEIEKINQITDYTIQQENVPLHGACYIFSKPFINRYNKCFYDKTFMYYESYILHYLAQRDNLKMVYSPDLKVIHHEDVSTNQSYNNMYKKSVFVNKCLEDSCKQFIIVMEDDSIKIN